MLKKSTWAAASVILFGVALLYFVGNTPERKVDPIPLRPADVVVHEVAAGEPVAERYFGYQPDRVASQQFVATLPARDLRTMAPGLFGREKSTVLLYRALNDAHLAHKGRPFKVGRQGIGDCVSWGWKHGVDIHLAVMWKVGDSAEWREAATESIYGGSRVEAQGRSSGGWGDGSYGAAAAKWVRDWGVTFRKPYNDFGFDLTTYSADRAKQWGNYGNGGSGDAGKFDAEAKRHPVRNVALVKTFDEAAAAIASGYPVPVCSGQGFASTRDANGFARAAGSWAHCMCFIGVRFDPDGLLCLNSWGPDWIDGPKWPVDAQGGSDMPDGSFWVARSTAENMLRGADSFAVSGYEGFPYRDLKHGDWVEYSPRDVHPPAASMADGSPRRYDARGEDNPFRPTDRKLTRAER